MQSPKTGPAFASDRPRGILPTIGGRYFALGALFSMNLLNYIDRYTFFAVGKQIQDELRISNEGYGYLSASFMIVYTVVSPLMGLLGDRYDRRVLLASGVGLWSLATVGTAFSDGFGMMFFWRALLGVGEASYGVIAPALLADLFPPRHRGRVMGLYFLALPLGGAIGYALGGTVAHAWNWRAAFWVVGLPGLLAAVAGLLLLDPGRGASEDAARPGDADPLSPGPDGGEPGGLPRHEPRRPRLRDNLDLFRTPTFVFNTLGMAAVTFATGAYAAWGSIFYQTVRGMNAETAGTYIGGMTALAGLIGIALGIWIPGLLLKVTGRAYLVFACAAVALAVPPGLFALLDPDRTTSLSLLFVAMVLMAMVLGPCNTVTANVVPANRRAAGYAVSIFLIHLLGDISSPILIGKVADTAGTAGFARSPLGAALASAGARPLGGTNLTAGMLAVIPVLVLGAVFFLIGSRSLPRDQEHARRAGGSPDGPAVFH